MNDDNYQRAISLVKNGGIRMAINKSNSRFPDLRGATFETREAAPAPGPAPSATAQAKALLAKLNAATPAPPSATAQAKALLARWGAALGLKK